MTDPETNGKGFTAPYASWGSFRNLIDRMHEEGLPQRIDRSYLSNMAGSTQSHILKALRELDLVDAEHRPTKSLRSIASVPPEERAPRVAEIVRDHYGDALALGQDATQSMLEELFTDEYGVKGSTRRKSIAFFLAACKYADISVSRHFRIPVRQHRPPRVTPRSGLGSAAGGKGSKREDDPPPPPPQADARDRYIALLLKKAEESDAADTDLLDRIERVIGVDPDQGGGR